MLILVAHGIISSLIFLIVYLVKSETTLPRKVDPQQHIAHAFSQVDVSLFNCGAEILKYIDNVQNNHSNLLPRASFHNLVPWDLPISFKVKSDVH